MTMEAYIQALCKRILQYPLCAIADTIGALKDSTMFQHLTKACHGNQTQAEGILVNMELYRTGPNAGALTDDTPKESSQPNTQVLDTAKLPKVEIQLGFFLLPVLITEYKRSEDGTNNLSTSGNQRMLDCIHAVFSLQPELKMLDIPVYGLATSGQYGNFGAAWCSSHDQVSHF